MKKTIAGNGRPKEGSIGKGRFVRRAAVGAALTLAVALAAVPALTGCASTSAGTGSASSGASTSASASKDAPIDVVSREDGSGTRGAFIELFGIEEKQGDKKVDMTTPSASITNSTSVMMTTVANDPNAIGYLSLGSLNDTVKAVDIDGVAATVDNIKSGDYEVSRPFNVVTTGELSPTAQDFLNFVLSTEGQQVVLDNGYIDVDAASSYSPSGASGTVTLAGSSSVSPVMEKLAEAYEELNPGVQIEINTSDSTTGVESAINGICDMGMASRELKDTETAKGVSATAIAMDGIAVVVNNDNDVSALTSEQVKAIFTGETVSWGEVA